MYLISILGKSHNQEENKLVKKSEKSPQQKAVIQKQDRVGKAANTPIMKQLVNTAQPDYTAAHCETTS